MNLPKPTIRVNVDPTNPGQFFACCGLLELADRLWGEAEGWFEGDQFLIASDGDLAALIGEVSQVELIQIDKNDATASPIGFVAPFETLRLDWWQDGMAGGRDLKVWAGSMDGFRIARAMQNALRGVRYHSEDLLDVGQVVYDPVDGKKKEPFYFDARRCPNAHSRDVGFAPNDLQMTTTALPAVEFFCLIGLQRCRPAKTNRPRVFRYQTWAEPLPARLAGPTVACSFAVADSKHYQFENWYRTGQKKHKAFRSAIEITS